MKKNSVVRHILPILFLMIISLGSNGAIRLHPMLASNMVVQQHAEVSFRGWARPGEAIRLRAGWNPTLFLIIAGEDGAWEVKVPTPGAGGPYTIAIEGENHIMLKNVMIGEVWICSGQSNMEYSINELGGWDAFGRLKKELKQIDLSRIRFCQVSKQLSDVPADSCQAAWAMAGISTVEDFSAVAFFYALELYQALNIPIGVISSNWSGTPAEAWTPWAALKSDPGLSCYLNHPNAPNWAASAPSVLYNGMIHPLRHFPVRGAIWYQGESNRWDSDTYGKLFTTMITGWRNAWNNQQMPFYFVQIAPYDYGDSPDYSGYLREAQMRALRLPFTGMVVTLDIGDLLDIHPRKKREVSHRLALWALAKTYRYPVPDFSGPIFKSTKTEGDKIRIFFDYAGKDLKPDSGLIEGFKIADSMGIFSAASARTEGNTVVVWDPEKKLKPCYARYAFGNTDQASLFGSSGLPASSFRTDSLPFFHREITIMAHPEPARREVSVLMKSPDPTVKIHYTLDGSIPGRSSSIYHDTITLRQSSTIVARAFKDSLPAVNLTELRFTRHQAIGKKITLRHSPSPVYPGNKFTLVDGLKGSIDHTDGRWQGFRGEDFEATLDLSETMEISSINIDFLQNIRAWIFPPTEITILLSEDGKNFRKVQSKSFGSPSKKMMNSSASVREAALTFEPAMARFVRVIAKSKHRCPGWHPGKGKTCWLFIGEVEVNQ